MNPLPVRAVARAAPALLLAVLLVAVGSAGARAASRSLSVSALSFARAAVDTSGGVDVDPLTWTVTDSNGAANYVAGDVTIQRVDRDTGALVGLPYVVPYSYGNTCCGDVIGGYVSGTPQRSTYTYDFPVPQYANTSRTSWTVTTVTIQDDQGAAVTLTARQLARFHATVATTAAVDSTGPTIGYVSQSGDSSPVRPYAYVGGTSATIHYDLDVQDGESGFWKGSLTMTGPAGQRLVTPFALTNDPDSDNIRCGDLDDPDPREVTCRVAVTFPAGSASGAWHLTAVTVTNNAEVRTTLEDPDVPAITVTSDEVVSAAGFTVSPNPVDDWRGPVMGQLTMSVAGARDGIAAVTVDFAQDVYLGCQQWSTPFTVDSDGTVSVPVRVSQSTVRCRVAGIAITDGAGDVALYGAGYGAPDPGLTITRVPDTTPPVATAASLSPDTLPASQEGSTEVQLTVQAELLTAPIDGISIYLYDSTGAVAGQSVGGVEQAADGSVTEVLPVSRYPGSLPPGTYTVGFELTDAGDLTSHYGELNWAGSQPVPGGPLVFTVTDN